MILRNLFSSHLISLQSLINLYDFMTLEIRKEIHTKKEREILSHLCMKVPNDVIEKVVKKMSELYLYIF
jgi:hypothetical protein